MSRRQNASKLRVRTPRRRVEAHVQGLPESHDRRHRMGERPGRRAARLPSCPLRPLRNLALASASTTRMAPSVLPRERRLAGRGASISHRTREFPFNGLSRALKAGRGDVVAVIAFWRWEDREGSGPRRSPSAPLYAESMRRPRHTSARQPAPRSQAHPRGSRSAPLARAPMAPRPCFFREPIGIADPHRPGGAA